MMGDQNEGKIISDILAGNKEKYRVLVEKYQDRLVNFIFAMVHNYDLANDIAQEAFIKAYFSLNKYNPKYQFSTWLYTIAINLSKSEFKKPKHLPLNNQTLTSGEENLTTNLLKKEQLRNIRQAVARLNKKYQLVINLYYWQDMNYQQIAQILNVKLNTVKTWLRRAKQQLKVKLDGQI